MEVHKFNCPDHVTFPFAIVVGVLCASLNNLKESFDRDESHLCLIYCGVDLRPSQVKGFF